MARVTVLGLGRMGAAMTLKLVEAGHEVTVWNRSRGPVDQMAAACNVVIGATPADAVADSEVVLSMLADGPTTETILLDADVLSRIPRDAVVCDMATSGVASARRLAASFATEGVRFVDAPVSGSVPTIQAGQLLIMASGDESGIETMTPVVMAFSKRVISLGEAGAGQAMKLAVNLIVHTLSAAVSESLALAVAAGISRESAYDVFQESVIAAPFVNYKRAAFLDPALAPAMTLTLSRKDLGLIQDFAASSGVSAELVAAALSEVGKACDAGMAERDMSALATYLIEHTAR